MKNKRNSRNFKKVYISIIGILLILLFIPTPYYLNQPGSIEPLASKVTVEDGQKTEKGSLNLTTVYSIKASNPYIWLYGLVAPHTEMKKEEEVKGDLSDEEYNNLLLHMMDSSKQNAIIASFHEANKEVEYQYNGVFVANVLPISKAKSIIKVGDIIHKVDGKTFNQAKQMIAYLKGKKAGDNIEIQYTHNKKTETATVEVINLDKKTGQVGIGINPEDNISINPSLDVDINSENIGGPSAGLMFSLEIYNQIAKGDLTKGYKVAGTGTMDAEGNVGQIGGIRHKIVAAHKAGVDIFFYPEDVTSQDTNEKEIKDQVKKEGYAIKIVPVRTLHEAIEYLEKLPEKKS
ncbi:SepM family pheromone-processing serine protease [Niallia nealsonii]|uniref:endopeptidase La n=1 Tax=Niallia nealsonii TaxID=115979 RepID=A0A2N0Z6G0_9BACI|nr:SepM family pheromone-processing serine protease [Niallia nealsonii]PKG25106.1 PDZ domain-containing protein [Niallia nealsonii]